jgi:hypothetical protein
MRALFAALLLLSAVAAIGFGDALSRAWSETAKLTASAAVGGDRFGVSVAMLDEIALIGADNADPVGSSSGTAVVFARSGSSWSEQTALVASDGWAGDNLGWSVSISGDTALLGAPGEDRANGSGNDEGAAYVFVRSGTSWSEQAKLAGSSFAWDEEFGYSVSIDGDLALIGAPHPAIYGTHPGSAYIFARTGTSWSQQAKLTASDGEDEDLFGYSVSLDGDYALVGAVLDNNANGGDVGAAYVFKRSGSTWTEQAKLIAGDGMSGDQFGNTLSLCGDSALIGAHFDTHGGGIYRGSAYVFTRSGSIWTQQAKLTASDGMESDNFGRSVFLSGDRALVGAPNDWHVTMGEGSAYVFTRSGSTWTEQDKLIASDAGSDDNFGFSVTLYGDTALVGAHMDDHAAGTNAGAAYAFELCGSAIASSEVVRNGTPPNPLAFQPGVSTGPVIGERWDPVVTAFMPGAFLDFVAVDFVGPLNVPTTWGTLLITPPPASRIYYNFAPGTPFSMGVPFDCTLAGIPAYTQGGSAAPGPTVQLANAIDIVFGTY